MKQSITLTQWNELGGKEKEKLFEWSKNCKSYQEEISEGDYDPYVVILNIGQMIEFLDEQKLGCEDERYEIWRVDTNNLMILWKGELCDILWEAVKEVLDSKE